MLIVDRQDILESLHWLAGQKIRVTACGARPVEMDVDRVI